MGADIHVQVEVRHRARWVHVCPPLVKNCFGSYDQRWYTGRCYDDFGKLAGVRTPCGPIEPRGWPFDAAEHTTSNYDRYKGCSHSPSWWTLAELHEHFDVSSNDHPNVLRLIGALDQLSRDGDDVDGEPYAPDDVRIVFFFDS